MDALALLRLQIEWGADEALAERPLDRLRPGPALQPAGPRPALSSPPALRGAAGDAATGRAPGLVSARPATLRPAGSAAASTPASTGTPAERAASLAGQAQTIDQLREALTAFDLCALRDTAANTVFAAGNPNADLLLVGEAPGADDDRSGIPFSGPDGALLDRMLSSIGLTRAELLLAPLIPWRPPGGRPPSPAEIALCLPFLHRLIALTAPRRLLLLGPLAARSLFGSVRRRTVPTWIEATIPGVPVAVQGLAMPAPAALARTPASRREAWATLRMLRRSLDGDLARL